MVSLFCPQITESPVLLLEEDTYKEETDIFIAQKTSLFSYSAPARPPIE